jgi:PLP dependent protein
MFTDVQERILRACQRAGRKPDEVKLVAVSKGHSAEEIKAQVLAYGHTVLGENRIQEWRDKAGLLPGVEWHFIGNLQRNKVKYCLPFSLIHSLNSLELAHELQKRAEQSNHLFRVLVEVKLAGEASKQGIQPEEAEKLVLHAKTLPNLQVEGLMTMAPYDKDSEAARPYFVKLRQIRDTLGLRELSMGMSGDFEVAIEEGATIIRVGSAIFA